MVSPLFTAGTDARRSGGPQMSKSLIFGGANHALCLRSPAFVTQQSWAASPVNTGLDSLPCNFRHLRLLLQIQSSGTFQAHMEQVHTSHPLVIYDGSTTRQSIVLPCKTPVKFTPDRLQTVPTLQCRSAQIPWLQLAGMRPLQAAWRTTCNRLRGNNPLPR